MQNWIIEILNSFGYLGVMLLIAVENIFPPIPSEVILTFGGFMTTYTEMQVWLVIVFATLGSVAGAIILYGLGRIFDVERLGRWIDRWGRILRLKRSDISKAELWFNRHGIFTVFFCRFIPIVRSLISIPAGMARMSFGYFLLLTIAGTAIWNIVLVNLGAFAGSQWERIAGVIDAYSHITLVALIVLGCAFLIWLVRRMKKWS
jgi:membrane protein DedA with SNARE-associated domain